MARTLKSLRNRSLLLGTALALLAPTGAAMAADTTLRIGHRWPANHYIQTQLVDVWTKGITDRLQDQIGFELYASGQLGADVPGTIHSGLLDVGIISSGAHPDLFPLTSVGELPQAAATSCEGSARIGALVEPGGILEPMEWGNNDLRVLSSLMLAPYGLFANKFAVNTVADVKGKKLWASNAAAEVVISSMGGVPLRLPSTELYDSAMRGTIDGAIFPLAGMAQYDLNPILSSSVHGVNFGSGVFFITIGTDAWEKLTDEQRVVLQEEAKKAQHSFCSYIDSQNESLRVAAAALPGAKTTVLEGEALAGFETALENVAETWVAQFERANRPGREVLEAYRAVEYTPGH